MPPATKYYVYKDRDGEPTFRVVRRNEKDFFVQHKNGRGWKAGLNGDSPPPYHLPDVISAIATGETVYVVEGEKDADSGDSHGITATCNYGGAGKWKDEHSKWLRNAARIIIIWDLDEEGAKHAWKVYDSLKNVGAGPILFRCAAAGKDLTDHLEEGFEVEQLIKRRPPKEESEKPDVQAIGDPDLPVAFKYIIEKLKAKPEGDPSENQFNALCPAHDDHRPSLSISIDEKRGRILLRCQANCEYDSIVQALGLTPSELRWETVESYQWKLDKRVEELELRADSLVQFESKRAGNEFKIELFDMLTGVDELAIPEVVDKYLIEGLFPISSRVMLIAEQKVGKTRFCLSLAKSICDEEPFLGRQVTIPDGARVLYLNGEMNDNMFRDWLREADFKCPERFVVKHFSGQAFPFWREDYRERLADWLSLMRIHLMIVDTQSIFMRGMVTNENDNIEVSRWQGAIDELRRAGEVPNVLVVHHTGKAEQGSGRGASVMGAWPDALWYLRKVGEVEKGEVLPQDAPRSFRAEGRMPAYSPVQLDYNDVTGLYTYGGISASEGRNLRVFEKLADDIRAFYADQGRWPLKGVVLGMLKGTKETRIDLLKDAVGRGLVHERALKGRSVECYVE